MGTEGQCGFIPKEFFSQPSKESKCILITTCARYLFRHDVDLRHVNNEYLSPNKGIKHEEHNQNQRRLVLRPIRPSIHRKGTQHQRPLRQTMNKQSNTHQHQVHSPGAKGRGGLRRAWACSAGHCKASSPSQHARCNGSGVRILKIKCKMIYIYLVIVSKMYVFSATCVRDGTYFCIFFYSSEFR